MICDTCQTGFQDFNSGEMCVKAIANCQNYDQENSELVCSSCEPGYQSNLSKKICFEKNDPNCENFESTDSGIDCQKCKSGFVILGANKTCFTEISGCDSHALYFNQGRF